MAVIAGTEGNDVLTGTAGDDTIQSGGGNERITEDTGGTDTLDGGSGNGVLQLTSLGLRCLIPRFDGAILSSEWKEAVWDRFVTGAPRPRTPSEQQYSDRKLRSRR